MNADYNPTPTPDSLTIRRDQETDCSNITIADDTLVEEDKEFGVVIVANASTFTPGVNIVQNSTFIVIKDDDGKKDPLNPFSAEHNCNIHMCITTLVVMGNV